MGEEGVAAGDEGQGEAAQGSRKTGAAQPEGSQGKGGGGGGGGQGAASASQAADALIAMNGKLQELLGWGGRQTAGASLGRRPLGFRWGCVRGKLAGSAARGLLSGAAPRRHACSAGTAGPSELSTATPACAQGSKPTTAGGGNIAGKGSDVQWRIKHRAMHQPAAGCAQERCVHAGCSAACKSGGQAARAAAAAVAPGGGRRCPPPTRRFVALSPAAHLAEAC